MSQDAAQLLASISSLVASSDADALVRLESHPDKAIRKAARKGLHQLRSRGVNIPDAPREKWNADAGLAAMRGDTEAVARVDMAAVPGATSVWLVDVGESGSLLCSTVVDAQDRVLACRLYGQTDGQRNRMLRDWDRGSATRRVPVSWARARITWARQQTTARGLPVPPTLNDLADRLGETPRERPVSFLADQFAVDQARAELDYDAALMRAECHRWPVLFEIEPFLGRIGEEYAKARSPEDEKESAPEPAEALTSGENPDDGLSEDQRVETLRRAAAGDDAVREALRGPMANLLDDAAIGAWQTGDDAVAKLLFDLAAELRASDTPETHEWAAYLLRFQVSTVAVRMLQQQAREQQGRSSSNALA